MTQSRGAPASARELTAVKHDIIKELFLKTGHQTYVIAGWCFLNQLYLDFYWNAVHGLESPAACEVFGLGQRPSGCQ